MKLRINGYGWGIAWSPLMARGAEVVVRKHQLRKSDFRSGIRYGKDDHSIRLNEPQRPDWMSQQEYDGYPEFIMIREIKTHVVNRGFRTREIIVHTSLWDDVDYSKEDTQTQTQAIQADAECLPQLQTR